jgi:hypothetical protein
MEDLYLCPTGNEKRTTEVISKRDLVTYNKQLLDLNLIKKRGNSKTFKGFLIGKLKEAMNNENKELAFILQEIYKRYSEYETPETIVLKSWKGKSSINIIEKPDYFIIITYQKDDQDSKPHEVKREVTKLEVNRIIKTINELNIGEKIPTRDIGERAYKRKWDDIFSDRFLHTTLNLILRLLDYYKIIKYRSRYSTVLNNISSIQIVLPQK